MTLPLQIELDEDAYIKTKPGTTQTNIPGDACAPVRRAHDAPSLPRTWGAASRMSCPLRAPLPPRRPRRREFVP